MYRYNIKVNEIKTTEFELNAKNKKAALALVEEIIINTHILDLKYIEHKTNYEVDITKTKRRKQNETNS